MKIKKKPTDKELHPHARLQSISLLVSKEDKEVLEKFAMFYTPNQVLHDLFEMHIASLASDVNDSIDKSERSNQAQLIKLLIDVAAIILKPINTQTIN